MTLAFLPAGVPTGRSLTPKNLHFGRSRRSGIYEVIHALDEVDISPRNPLVAAKGSDSIAGALR